MKKSLPIWLFVLSVFCLTSCTSEEAQPEPGILPEAVDTYLYIALRNDGQLFEVGNKTGKISPVNKIPGINFNMVFNAVTSSSTDLYIYEHKFPPQQSSLHVYNRTTKTSQTKSINFSPEIFGEAPGLVSLEWDESSSGLIGLVKEHYEEGPHHKTRVARLDPDTFEVSSLDIEIDRAHIISTQLVGNKIYTSTYKTSTGSGRNDFFHIDLTTGAATSVEINNMVRPPIHLSKSSNNNVLFGFLPTEGTGFAGAARPVLIDLSGGQITELYPDEIIGNKNFNGRSFFNATSGEHVDFITSGTYHGLFQYNTSTNKVTVTELPLPNELSSLVTIVDVRKVD